MDIHCVVTFGKKKENYLPTNAMEKAHYYTRLAIE